jgi:hypothetical protein
MIMHSHMKLSKIFHVKSVIIGFLGVIALISSWCVGPTGDLWGMDQSHLFQDALIFILIAIWIQLATMHHMKLEEKGELV